MRCTLLALMSSAGSSLAEWGRLRGMRRAGEFDALIAELGNPRAGDPAHGSPFSVREGAIMELAKLRDRRAGPAIAGMLSDPLASVRSAAAYALGSVGSSAEVGALLEALNDAEPEVRGNVARSLGNLNALVAVDPLIKALEDENRWVRTTVAFSLGRLGDERARVPLKNLGKREGFRHPMIRLRIFRSRMALRRGRAD